MLEDQARKSVDPDNIIVHFEKEEEEAQREIVSNQPPISTEAGRI